MRSKSLTGRSSVTRDPEPRTGLMPKPLKFTPQARELRAITSTTRMRIYCFFMIILLSIILPDYFANR
jgi:hypothetical protein